MIELRLEKEAEPPEHRGWYWPAFDRLICGEMTDRERLGLPDHLIAARFDDVLPAVIHRLLTLSASELVALIESRNTPLVERIAAGNILALIGDPRIQIFRPAMLGIRGGAAEIGLEESEVDRVLEHFHGLGLERKWIVKECPRHRVELAPYRLAKYPVTNAEYREFLLDSCYSEIPDSWSFRRYPAERSNHPVYTVTIAAALAYIAWLNEKTGRRFRLPTEAEWEFAAAGPHGLEFPWGNTFDADLANTAETGLFCSTAVGIFPDGASPFGILDVAGNVEEYTADIYAAYPGGQYVDDHLTQLMGDYHVARGGSFARFRDLARTRRRHGQNPASTTYAMGFRLAESL